MTGPARVYWSNQITIITTGVWLPILYGETQRHPGLQRRSLMLMGQLVAISFASAQSFAYILGQPPKQRVQLWAPISLVIATLGGLALSAYAPHTTGSNAFMPVLLAIHAVLFWPLWSTPTHYSIDLSSLYLLSSVASGLVHLVQSAAALEAVDKSPRQLIAVAFRAHPAQGSVSWDVVCVTVILLAWCAMETSRTATMARDWRAWTTFAIVVASTPVLGAACTTAAYLALVELEQPIAIVFKED